MLEPYRDGRLELPSNTSNLGKGGTEMAGSRGNMGIGSMGNTGSMGGRSTIGEPSIPGSVANTSSSSGIVGNMGGLGSMSSAGSMGGLGSMGSVGNMAGLGSMGSAGSMDGIGSAGSTAGLSGGLGHDDLPEPAEVLVNRMLARMEGVVLGKRDTAQLALAAAIAGGHILLEDVPGVGKTMLARAMARIVGGKFARIQFTSDMLPADVVGGLIWDSKRNELVFREGPIMANIVLADEINRASPRTQSALLEVMEEGTVTADGESRSLPAPFILLATQNPIGWEGTHTLPEAQLDRFMMRLSLGYPKAEDEVRMLERAAGEGQPEQLRPVISADGLLRMQRAAAQVFADRSLLEYAVAVVRATREAPELLLGASPRASRDWTKAAKALAYMSGRKFLVPDDLKATAHAVLLHRLAPDSAYGEGAAALAAECLERILAEQPIPAGGGLPARRVR